MERFPNELLLITFRHLSPTQIARIRRVCTRWNAFIDASQLPITTIEIRYRQCNLSTAYHAVCNTNAINYRNYDLEEKRNELTTFMPDDNENEIRSFEVYELTSMGTSVDYDNVKDESTEFNRLYYQSNIHRWSTTICKWPPPTDDAIDAFIEYICVRRLIVVSMNLVSIDFSTSIFNLLSTAIERRPEAFNIVHMFINAVDLRQQPFDVYSFIRRFSAHLEILNIGFEACAQIDRTRLFDLVAMPRFVGFQVYYDLYPRNQQPITMTDQLVDRLICNKLARIDFNYFLCEWSIAVLCAFVHRWHEHRRPLDYFNGNMSIQTSDWTIANFDAECRRIQLPYYSIENQCRRWYVGRYRYIRISNRFHC